uniref:Luc7-like protein 3 n=1 Tax=Romanomermis culicivorax TaxID=13658 RepID=A0A915JVQ5_ROMCU
MANPLSAMLDELMGRNRNANPGEAKKEPKWDDPDICPYFLAGYCPHEMFVNTKADLGPCRRTHDEKLRDDYRKSSRFEKVGLEEDFLNFLQKVQADMQRKIDRNKQRLDLTQPGGQVRVEEAQSVVQMMEELREERDRLQQNFESPSNELRSMEVCDICGCFLVMNDAQHRLDEHFTGKQHLGFAKIKVTVDELLRKRQERRVEREKEEEKSHRHSSRHSSRSSSHHRRNDKDDNDKDRHHTKRRDSKTSEEKSRRESSKSRHESSKNRHESSKKSRESPKSRRESSKSRHDDHAKSRHSKRKSDHFNDEKNGENRKKSREADKDEKSVDNNHKGNDKNNHVTDSSPIEDSKAPQEENEPISD